MNKDKCKFYLIIMRECVLFPFLYIRNEIKQKRRNGLEIRKERAPVEQKNIYVFIHEWGSYPYERIKTLKNGVSFRCGLKWQIERFSSVQLENYDIKVNCTLSDSDKCIKIKEIEQRVNHLYFVNNDGMDFSGYSYGYKQIKNEKNAYVILMNSSVNSFNQDFLSGYVDYMEKNQDVGMLGISYCTRMTQTLISNNFTPHIQSFFILTTIDLLNQIVTFNGGQFPGEHITYKRLLVREGEIKLSQLVLKMGYALAVVQSDGAVYKFNKHTSYRDWEIPKGDARLFGKEPNKIHPITIL